MIIYIATILLLIILCIIVFFYLDSRYKKTNWFLNQHIELENYSKVPSKPIDLAVFGSTYALYSFQSLQKLVGEHSLNFSLNAESLELDSLLLQRYIGNIKEGGTVFFVLAPCVCYYRYYQSNPYNAYFLLNKKDLPNYNWIKNFKFNHPLIFNGKIIKNIFHVLVDNPRLKSLDEFFPVTMTQENSIKNMRSMAEGWKRLFHLKDLKEETHDSTNLANLDFNANVLANMLNTCRKYNITPYFVIPPFSKELNQYFGKDFLECGLYKMLKLADPKGEITVLDYREEEYFQDNISLYADGGFRLNEEGSRIFCKKIIRNLRLNSYEENNK